MTERFELLSQLGKGGMGVVWKARDTETGEIIALKLLHSIYSQDPDYIARFEREIEVARRIQSPYVVKVLGFGNRDGQPYMSMEYVAGPSLSQLLHERISLPWEEASRIITDVTRGLSATHAAGVIHRDLKPSNIMVDQSGRAKIADFGIARASDLTGLTGAITTLGTAGYIAPEGRYSVQSDLYSLGCVLFEMLSGGKLFEGESMQQIMVRHIREDPDLSSLDSRAIPIVAWLLQKEASARPADCEHLLHVLTGVTRAPDVAPSRAALKPTSGPEASDRWPRARRRPLRIAGAGAVLAIGTVAVLVAVVVSRPGVTVAMPTWSIDTAVRTAFAPAPGERQVEMTIGPVVYAADRVAISFGATPRCATGADTMNWTADVGTSNVAITTTASGTAFAENGWGLGNQDAILSCNTTYVGTWVFTVGTSDAISLTYPSPKFEISLPGRSATQRRTNVQLQLATKLRLEEQLTVTSSLCLVSLTAPAKGAPAGPCFSPRERLRVTFGPVDNLQRWFEVTAEDGARGWIDQEGVGVSLSP